MFPWLASQGVMPGREIVFDKTAALVSLRRVGYANGRLNED
jgi:hypothetical protein